MLLKVVGGARAAAKHPTRHWTAPTPKRSLVMNVSSAKIEIPMAWKQMRIGTEKRETGLSSVSISGFLPQSWTAGNYSTPTATFAVNPPTSTTSICISKA